MDSVSLFVGLDYHQDSIQLCELDAMGGVRVNRSLPSEVAAVVAELGRGRVKAVAIEACCRAAAFGE